MKKCRICERMVEDHLQICPHCGHNFNFKAGAFDPEKYKYETMNEHFYNAAYQSREEVTEIENDNTLTEEEKDIRLRKIELHQRSTAVLITTVIVLVISLMVAIKVKIGIIALVFSGLSFLLGIVMYHIKPEKWQLDASISSTSIAIVALESCIFWDESYIDEFILFILIQAVLWIGSVIAGVIYNRKERSIKPSLSKFLILSLPIGLIVLLDVSMI